MQNIESLTKFTTSAFIWKHTATAVTSTRLSKTSSSISTWIGFTVICEYKIIQHLSFLKKVHKIHVSIHMLACVCWHYITVFIKGNTEIVCRWQMAIATLFFYVYRIVYICFSFTSLYRPIIRNHATYLLKLISSVASQQRIFVFLSRNRKHIIFWSLEIMPYFQYSYQYLNYKATFHSTDRLLFNRPALSLK